MNRIEIHRSKVRDLIAAGGKTGTELDTPEKVAEFDKTFDLEFDEHFAYQTAQSQAFAAGKLSLEEAQIVYWALGEGMSESNGGWAKGVDTATKVTVTMLMGQLIGVAA